jgi:effector-binding domain-containing protein
MKWVRRNTQLINIENSAFISLDVDQQNRINFYSLDGAWLQFIFKDAITASNAYDEIVSFIQGHCPDNDYLSLSNYE